MLFCLYELLSSKRGVWEEVRVCGPFLRRILNVMVRQKMCNIGKTGFGHRGTTECSHVKGALPLMHLEPTSYLHASVSNRQCTR